MEKIIYLDKARKNIEAAQLLFDNQLYDDSANRAYYGAFNAALASLSNLGTRTEGMSHEAVQARFNNELIHRRKIYPNRFKSYLLDLLSVRIDVDYRLESISKKVASRQINKAKEFIERIEQEMDK